MFAFSTCAMCSNKVLYESREANSGAQDSSSPVKTAVILYEDMISQPEPILRALCKCVRLSYSYWQCL